MLSPRAEKLLEPVILLDHNKDIFSHKDINPFIFEFGLGKEEGSCRHRRVSS